MSSINLTSGSPSNPAPLPMQSGDNVIQGTNAKNAFARIEEELHGGMDDDNLTSSRVTHDKTRKKALAWAKTVGGTASLDWGRYLFSQVDQEDWSNDRAPAEIALALPRMEPVPGACDTLFLEAPALVEVTWNVFWVNDMWNTESVFPQSHLAFHMDGVPIRYLVRSLGYSCTIDGSKPKEVFQMQGYKKNRQWTGHYQAVLAAGEHSFGLRVLADKRVPNTRIWVRSMRTLVYPGAS